MSFSKCIDLKKNVVDQLMFNKEYYQTKLNLYDYTHILNLTLKEKVPTYIINIYIEICYQNINNIYFKNREKYKNILLVFMKLYIDFPKTIISLIEELPNYFFLVNLLNLIFCILCDEELYISVFFEYIKDIKILSKKILNIFVFQLTKDYDDLLMAKKNNLPYPSISTLILYLTKTNTSDIFIDKVMIKMFRNEKDATPLFNKLKSDLTICIEYLLEKNSNYILIYDYFDVYTINSVCLKRFYKKFWKEINIYLTVIEPKLCSCCNELIYVSDMNSTHKIKNKK